MCMFCLNFSHINHQTSNVGIITPPQYVCPIPKQAILVPSFKPSLCVSLSLFHYTLFYSVHLYCTVHNIDMVWYFPRSLTSTLTSTPLCRSSCLHPHLMIYPVEVYFASNANVVIFLMTAKVVEVMRNTSGTAPDFPNVELKSADSMFLALILYLSWQRKDG